MITNAFRMRRSEYVLGRPRGRLAGAGGQGRWSMSSTRLTRRLIWRSISVPPQCGCVVTEILRGQLCCDDAWHGCFIYDHVSISQHYMNITTKAVYFVFGLCLSGMMLSGIMVWTKRTAKSTAKLRQRDGLQGRVWWPRWMYHLHAVIL